MDTLNELHLLVARAKAVSQMDTSRLTRGQVPNNGLRVNRHNAVRPYPKRYLPMGLIIQRWVKTPISIRPAWILRNWFKWLST